jgi:tetratricopeptide (TPR) repeat protein
MSALSKTQEGKDVSASRELADARKLQKLGRLDEAEALFRSVADKAPTCSAALIGLGQIERKLGNHMAALGAFETALKIEPHNTGIKNEIAYLLRNLGRLDEAEAAFRELIEQSPGNANGLVGLGRTLQDRGDRSASLAAFQAAALSKPDDRSIATEVARDLQALARFDEAKAAYKSISDQDPGNATALIGLGQISGQGGDHAAALTAFEAALKIEPNNSGVKAEIAYLLRQMGRRDEAEAMFLELLAQAPGNASALSGLGYILRDRGDRSGALAAFEAAAAANPHNVNLSIEAANDLRELGHLDEADAMFRRALDVDPKNLAAMTGQGRVRRQRGDRLGAVASFKAAIAADPKNLGVKVEFAYLLRDLGRIEDAEAAFGAVLAEAPSHASALSGLGWLMADLHRLDEAQAFFVRSVDADPKNVGCRIALGHLARRRGEHTAALIYFESALAIDPAHIDARLERAAEFRDRGDFEEARRLIDAVIATNSGHVQALMHLGQLQRRQGDRVAALAAFEKARVAQPGHIQALLEAATEKRALGDPHAAERLVKAALDLDPQHLGALIQEADQATWAEDFDGALAIARRGIASHPHRIWPYLQAARSAAELGNHAETAEFLRLATQMCGAQPEIAATRAQFARNARDWPAARAALAEAAGETASFSLWSERVMLAINTGAHDAAEQMLKQAPAASTKDRGRVHLFAAQLAEAERRYEAAVAEYREAVRLDPADSWAHSEMARALMITLDLAGAREHLGISIALNASANIMRGQSLNLSQHHLGQILDEFAFDPDLVGQLRTVRALPPAEQLGPLQALVRNYPDHTVPALLLAIAMRQAGLFGGAAPIGPASAARPIPRRIVQFWNDADPPPDIQALMASWREAHPEFQYLRFDDKSARAFIAANFPLNVSRAFGRARHPAQRSDIFRLAYLGSAGGFYADADDRCLAHIETYVPQEAALMLYQENYGTLGNNFLGTSARHPVIVRALALATGAMNRGDNDVVWLSSGPGLLTRAFAQVVAGAVPDAADWSGGTVVRELGEIQGAIGFHCPVRYKRTDRHWNRAATRRAGPARK